MIKHAFSKINLTRLIRKNSFSSRKITMEEAKKFVQDTISSTPVVVFSKTYCPYCVKAKNLLETLVPKDKLNVIELEDRPDCTPIQTYLKELTGASSVPRVFINQKCIGGCDDTFRLEKSGELKNQLESIK